MVFSSHIFLFVFLPAVLALYYLSPRGGRSLLLTLFSYLFYGWANPLFVILMLVSTAIDFIAGRAIALADPANLGRKELLPLAEGEARNSRQKFALIASITSNLTLLGFFKYYNFGVENVARLLEWLGVSGGEQMFYLNVVLPLGISFYTFQSMSYAIDVYRGHAVPLRRFTDFACYISLFPQLVAGPIIRYQDVADQMVERSHTWAKFSRGIAFFSIGLGKKILLANPCGRIADTAFASADLSPLDAWTGIFAYSMQIYFDFSGYSDMAVGLGLMLGFVFIRNFNSPYKSTSVTQFWQNWHMSLSTWLRDYLYIPLGGNRKGPSRTYVNLFLVMLIGGIWHGASWNFAIWGGAHGLWLAAERFLSTRCSFRLPTWISTALTFTGVSLLWIPFRAPDLESAARYARNLLPGDFGNSHLVSAAIHTPYLLGCAAIAFMVAFLGIHSWDLTRNITRLKAAYIIALLVLSSMMLASQSYNPFIYFIF
jgi:alginate O-acetyltransferase complex protein AlgI